MIENKKGELGVGMIIIVAVAVIMGLVLFQATALNVEKTTQTITGASTYNGSITWGAVNAIQELTGQELVEVINVTNATNSDIIVAAANYSIYECVRSSDNLKGICLKTIGDKTKDKNMGSNVPGATVTYTYYPEGYTDNAGGRAIVGIIVLLTAMGIALVAFMGVKSKFD